MTTEADSIEAPLPSSLLEKYTEIQALFARATGDEARTRFLVGKKIREIKESEATYGTRAVTKLAKALGRDEATLYRYALVAERWSDEGFAALMSRRTPRGEPLSWTHLVELAAVDDDAERAMLIEEAVREALSVRALVSLIRGDRQDETLDGRSLPLKRIAAHLEIARRQAETVSGLLDRMDARGGTRENVAMLFEVERIHGELIRQLRTWKERLDAMRTSQARESAPPITRAPYGVPARAGAPGMVPPRTAGTMPRFLSGAASR